jgi:Helix-turn-helix of DDE superfamily endonuclease
MPSYDEVTQRAGSVRAMTGLTPQEFTALLPHFERAFLAYMEDHTIDGQPRTNRRYSTYDTSPLPTMADKLLFILTYLKQNPIQEVQGQLFGMSQALANKWIHLLHTVLNQALAQQELLPAHTAAELATLLPRKQAKEEVTSPLFGMMVLSDPSIAHGMPKSSKNITGARRSATRSKISL